MRHCAGLCRKKTQAFSLLCLHRDFTCWLQSLRSNQETAARLRGGGGQGPAQPPQVTISGVSGNIVQYNALNSPTIERTSRPWRSNSLTPPTSCQLQNLPPSSEAWSTSPFHQSKGRSHSLTFDRDQIPNGSGDNLSPAVSASALEDKEVEDMIKNLPDGSGMKGSTFQNTHNFGNRIESFFFIRDPRVAEIAASAQIHQDFT